MSILRITYDHDTGYQVADPTHRIDGLSPTEEQEFLTEYQSGRATADELFAHAAYRHQRNRAVAA